MIIKYFGCHLPKFSTVVGVLIFDSLNWNNILYIHVQAAIQLFPIDVDSSTYMNRSRDQQLQPIQRLAI